MDKVGRSNGKFKKVKRSKKEKKKAIFSKFNEEVMKTKEEG